MARAEVSVSADSLTPFEPLGLGAESARFRSALDAIDGRRQSEIIAILTSEAGKCGQPETYERAALKFSLLILRDHVASGAYPVIRGGRCALAQVDGSELSSGRSRLRTAYRNSRARALAGEGKSKSLAAFKVVAADLRPQVGGVIDLLEQRSPSINLRVAGKEDRILWNAVRATWSMPPDRSAPGRQVSFLVGCEEAPEVPLAIFQFRNVVPEIRARDLWLGVSSDGVNAGFMSRIAREADSKERLRQTHAVVDGLLRSVHSDGFGEHIASGDDQWLSEMARKNREAFNSAKREGDGDAQLHLRLSKRAATAAELTRGARGLKRLMEADDAAGLYASDGSVRREVDVALRKIWHYHMGFVAIELAICGAAPPFGPLRAGKLAAALAGAREAVEAWGVERPLGEIAEMVYRPEVRDAVPNPGPLVIFTSGLYPNHSAQYERATSGRSRWEKIGDTSGFGSSHLSADTVSAADYANRMADGYVHISRSFGEGAGARFRAVGRAIDRLSVPDVRRHETSRPLYALPLVDDVLAVLAGWVPANRLPLPTANQLGEIWWQRWLEPRKAELAAEARRQVDLAGALSALEREVQFLE